ncbi:MAG: hypothetical protein M3O30_05790 [Planctomycetota bacterium]|nr:hypothetical protein [Planctomycetota bacterium]
MPGTSLLTPTQILAAYGYNGVAVSGTTVTGAGETIAIVDAYSPVAGVNLQSDLNAFDTQYGLAATTLVITQNGTIPVDPSTGGGWTNEMELDIEWAHAIAPGATIELVEAPSNSDSDLYGTAKYAATLSGVAVVSMSFGRTDFSGESADDTNFSQANVAFVAGSGDNNGNTPSYPATSPNVLAVGGTNLTLNSNNTINTETVWNEGSGVGSTGGVSTHEPNATYQDIAYFPMQNRSSPDVAFSAQNMVFYSSNSNLGSPGLYSASGTSFGTPCWAATIALADQGRSILGAISGQGPMPNLGSRYQLLPLVYDLLSPKLDFNDITSGGNANDNAQTGYDFTTGWGSPKANLVIKDLANAIDIEGTSGADTITGSVTGTTLSTITNGGTAVNYSVSSHTSLLVNGYQGNDSIAIDSSVTFNTVLLGETGNDTISGGSGQDVINGEGGADSISGNNGNDILMGGSTGTGADTIVGNAGNDTIVAGTAGGDSLQGAGGDDLFYTNQGANHGTAAMDSVYGGAGTNTAWLDSIDQVPNNDVVNKPTLPANDVENVLQNAAVPST